MPKEKQLTAGANEIAEILGIDKKKVMSMTAQGIISTISRGRYDVVSTCRDYIKYLQEKLRKPLAKGIDAERARLLAAQADIAEKENAFLSHELVPAEHVTKLIQGMNMAVRAKLLSMPTKIAAVILSVDTLPEAQSIIKAEINEALKELHDDIPSGAEGYLPKFSKSLAASA